MLKHKNLRDKNDLRPFKHPGYSKHPRPFEHAATSGGIR
jgi:hypothetical protein